MSVSMPTRVPARNIPGLINQYPVTFYRLVVLYMLKPRFVAGVVLRAQSSDGSTQSTARMVHDLRINFMRNVSPRAEIIARKIGQKKEKIVRAFSRSPVTSQRQSSPNIGVKNDTTRYIRRWCCTRAISTNDNSA